MIDLLSAQDDYPQRPMPVFDVVVDEAAAQAEDGSDEARVSRIVRTAAEWAVQEPDDDTWDGFYLSLDLLSDPPGPGDEDN